MPSREGVRGFFNRAFFWTDERTTIPYDLWVVAILAFVWLTPPDWLGDPTASGQGSSESSATSSKLLGRRSTVGDRRTPSDDADAISRSTDVYDVPGPPARAPDIHATPMPTQ